MERHITVFQKEAVDALALSPASTVVDATLGSGGHATRILNILDTTGTFIGIDVDAHAVENARAAFADSKATKHFICRNFREVGTILDELGIRTAHAILADLGWRIEQFEGGGRGFSFKADEPLLMTYGDPTGYLFTARDIVNDWSEEDIANVLRGYGEERYARRIAHAIVETRTHTPIETSVQLAHIVEHSVPGHYTHGKIHPATRTFQALRIAVNDELKALEQFMADAVAHLSAGGRLAIITFHSIEDRLVKHTFRGFAEDGQGTVITKKAVKPADEEVHANPRSRSAKLRIFEKGA